MNAWAYVPNDRKNWIESQKNPKQILLNDDAFFSPLGDWFDEHFSDMIRKIAKGQGQMKNMKSIGSIICLLCRTRIEKKPAFNH